MIVNPIVPPTPDFMNKFKDTYISFAPRIRVEWTPCLYYYMNGKRKLNLHSSFPTFSFDYERGIKGVFKSTGEYERIEFDLQHHVPLGPAFFNYWMDAGITLPVNMFVRISLMKLLSCFCGT